MLEFEIIRSEPPLNAYIQKPEGTGPFPAVIVFMHRPGADKSMLKVVDDLTQAGFVGVCHDAYRNDTIKDSYTDKTIFEDFEATLQFIKNLSYVIPAKIGAMGFCMGGRHVYLSASRYPELKAVVSYYGFPGNGGEDSEDKPINVVDKMSVPVLGIFGRQDHLFPFKDVETFRSLLLEHSTKNKVVVYDDVGHGFLNPYSERHKDGISAKKAWKETIMFYKTYLA